MRVDRILSCAGLLGVCVLAAGCLNSDTLIKVKADGSGTIEQTILVNQKTFESFGAMLGQMAGGDAKTSPSAMPSPAEMLDEAKLKEAAARYGRGVRYVSSTPLEKGEMKGARAVFAFDDINGLNVSQTPDSPGRGKENPITFRLDKRPDGSSILTVKLAEADPEEAAKAGAAPTDTPRVPPEALAIIKPFLQDLRVAIAIDVAGTLVRTNADHVTGTRVTLIDLDFGPLLANPGAFEKLSSLGPGARMSDVRPLVKDVPGVKVNTNTAITIEFR